MWPSVAFDGAAPDPAADHGTAQLRADRRDTSRGSSPGRVNDQAAAERVGGSTSPNLPGVSNNTPSKLLPASEECLDRFETIGQIRPSKKKGNRMTDTQAPRNAKADVKAAKAYAKATRPWYKKKRFWLLGIIALIAIYALTSGGDDDTTANGTSTGSSQETSAAADAPAAEPAMVVTAQQMLDDLEANPLAASTKYKDKLVTVTGKLDNIDASGNYFSLTGTDEFAFVTNVTVDIEEEQKATVGGFTMGQDVTVTGTVKDVGEIMGFRMDAETIG